MWIYRQRLETEASVCESLRQVIPVQEERDRCGSRSFSRLVDQEPAVGRDRILRSEQSRATAGYLGLEQGQGPSRFER